MKERHKKTERKKVTQNEGKEEKKEGRKEEREVGCYEASWMIMRLS